ncbi:MAG TPA: chromosomal replication initiator protein DnaA [Bacteroidota bacterium]|nr:chromosomal replication initiator protein DnaA [Bacteroidota bacterium]
MELGESPLPDNPLSDQSSISNSQISDPAAIWNQCLEHIRTRINAQSYKTWFEPINPLSLDDQTFVIQVPSEFFSEWIEEHYYSLITECLARLTGRELSIEYDIIPDDREDPTIHILPDPPQHRPQDQQIINASAISSELPRSSLYSPQPVINPSLNARYTFDNYIKGESNQFARAAAMAVANNPGGTSFNPLVIYGGVGLGKTHLVHAIGNHLLHTHKTKRVLYTSSEKFTVDFVEAIQRDKVGEFSAYYRSVDLLIVDDIQFLTGKEKTQDIFFHTFNALHQVGKQIVLSSDRPPKELQGLNERLISRFQWGLTADIQPPDLETRIAILRKKSSDEGVNLAHDVVEFIASNVTSNIRELEGCLIGLLARASLENRPLNLDLARDVVRSIIGEVRSHITIEEIQRAVCEHMDIPQDILRAKTRKQEVVNARQIAMYLSKELTNSSLKTIGLHFGGRDHSTVIHAYQTVEDLMKTDPRERTTVQQIKSKLERTYR